MLNNLWQVDMRFYCPLIGICLTINEQRKILHKAKYDTKKLSDYLCHEILVGSVKKDTPLIRRMQKFLDEKYKDYLEYWDDKTNYLYIWNKMMAEDNVGGYLYGLIRQADISKDEIKEISGSLHILAYYKMQKISKIKQDFEQEKKRKIIAEQKTAEWKINFYTERKSQKVLAQTINRQKQEIKLLDNENDKLKKLAVPNEKYQSENMKLRERISGKENKIINLNSKISNLENKLKSALISLEKKEETNLRLMRELKEFLKQLHSQKEDCEKCLNYDLCKRRILLVGGVSKLRSFYKQAVESFDGIFEYHEGYLNNGKKCLSDLIHRSDIVLFPVDVNSHGACLSVKRFCRKWKKPYYILKSSGVSSLNNTLSEISKNVCD